MKQRNLVRKLQSKADYTLKFMIKFNSPNDQENLHFKCKCIVIVHLISSMNFLDIFNTIFKKTMYAYIK